jgi:hypothetical protein
MAGLAAVALAGWAIAQKPEGLFLRIKAHITDHLAHLPQYTCHETIQRRIMVRNTWQYLDTVELEVAFAGQEELYSRPGSDRFGEQGVEQIAGGGTIGNGALGSHIDLIFSRDAAEFKFGGACKKDGHKTFRYDLHVPIDQSGFRVRRAGAEGMAGYDGSVWVDADTLDLVRVDFKVNRIPAHIGVRLIEESLHYKNVTIGKSEFDLPDHSELGAFDAQGTYSLNTIKLDRCREFTADSVVKYGSPSEGTAARERQDH